MARYTGPKSKISRKYGEPIFGDTKALEKKPHPPGQHGRGRRRKKSEYAIQLAEKQKAKYLYGILEKQFRNMFDKASRKSGITGENLFLIENGTKFKSSLKMKEDFDSSISSVGEASSFAVQNTRVQVQRSTSTLINSFQQSF